MFVNLIPKISKTGENQQHMFKTEISGRFLDLVERNKDVQGG